MTIIVDNEDSGIRLDVYLSDKLPDISRSRLQSLIKEGEVIVNNSKVKVSYKTASLDVIEITLPEASLDLAPEPEDIPIDVLYEDDSVLIVNKGKNMVVHPAPGHESGTLVNAVMFHCQDSLSGINGVLRPGIVHRIDKDTTGSLIICKNDYAHNFIAEQIAEHSVNRIYIGIVIGNLKEDEGTIDAPLGRNPKDRKKMAIVSDGRRAVTHYKVLKRLKGYTFCEFKLETGRTHQIRVHMASIGHPLLGDPLYGPLKTAIKGLEGQCLHAKTIGFIHPDTKEYLEVSAPVPEYLDILITKLS